MKRFFFILFMLIHFAGSALMASDYVIAPQIINPEGNIKMMQASYSGDFFAVMDENKNIDIFNKEGILVLSWHDPEPEIERNKKTGSKEYLKTINTFRLFPESKKFLAAASRGNILFLVDYNGKILQKIKIAKNIQKIFISPDESRFIIVPYDWQKSYFLLTDSSFKVIKKISSEGVYDAVFSEDGKHLVVSEDPIETKEGWKATMRLFTSDGAYIRDIENDRPGRIVTAPEGAVEAKQAFARSVIFLPDGKRVAYIGKIGWSDGGEIRVSSIDGKKTYQFPVKNMFAFSVPSLARGGKYIAVITSGYEGSVDYYTFEGKLNSSVALRDLSGEDRYYYSHNYAVYLPSSGNCAMLEEDSSYRKHGTDKIRVKVVNSKGDAAGIAGNNPLREFTDIRISHDGSEIALQRENGDIPSLLINTLNGRVEEIEGSVRYDSRGRRMISKWIMTGPEGNRKNSNIMEYTIGSKKFNIAGGGTILPDHHVAQHPGHGYTSSHWILYNDKGEALKKINHEWVWEHGHDMSPDMKTVLYKAELRNFSDGKKIKFFFDRHLTGIGRFNPSGTKVITGLEHGEMIIWDMTGKPGGHLKGHSSMVTGMGMTSDDNILVSVAPDNRIIIRNFKTGIVALMYFFKDNSYLIYTDKGEYDYTGNNQHLIELSSNGEIVTDKYKNARVKNLLHRVVSGR
ncbi:MAG TPA: WD40 repeat domain-containing protein [Spirochaetota bacterium]|nr:WD40 repeat domain-containing protein [Spirochaetota bacterium]